MTFSDDPVKRRGLDIQPPSNIAADRPYVAL